MNDQRRQLEKESALRLELEDKIMTHMQQKLTHSKAAKYSQRLTSKIAALKKEKVKIGFRKKHSECFRLWESRSTPAIYKCTSIKLGNSQETGLKRKIKIKAAESEIS